MFDTPTTLVSVVAAAWLFLLGLCVGSFLNVVIARLPEGLSVVRPRSRCPHCGHGLPWYENIPVFSYIGLRGRCSGCKAPISARYPAVELLTGLLFLACWARFGWGWELVSALVLVGLLVPLAFIDLEHWILPFELTRPGIVLGVLCALPLGAARVSGALLGALLGFVLFWGLEWLGRKIFRQEALGGGDKYLLALLGAFLTARSLLGIIFLSSFQGSIVGLALKALTGRAGPSPAAPKEEPERASSPEEEDEWVPGPSNIPFGPWLALSGLELLLLGPWLGAVLPRPLGSYLGGG